MNEYINYPSNKNSDESALFFIVEEILKNFDYSKGLEVFILDLEPEFKKNLEEYKIIIQSYLFPILKKAEGKYNLEIFSIVKKARLMITSLDYAIKHHDVNSIIQCIDDILKFAREVVQKTLDFMTQKTDSNTCYYNVFTEMINNLTDLKRIIIGIRTIFSQTKKNKKDLFNIKDIEETWETIEYNSEDLENSNYIDVNMDSILKTFFIEYFYFEFENDNEMISFLDDLIEQEPVLYKYYSIKNVTLRFEEGDVYYDFRLKTVTYFPNKTKAFSENKSNYQQIQSDLVIQDSQSPLQSENSNLLPSNNSRIEIEDCETIQPNITINRNIPIDNQGKQSYGRNLPENTVRYLYKILVDNKFITEPSDHVYDLFYARINGMVSKDFKFDCNEKITWKEGEEALRQFFFFSYTIFEKQFTKGKLFFNFPNVDTDTLNRKTKDAVSFIKGKLKSLSIPIDLTTNFIRYLKEKGQQELAKTINENLDGIKGKKNT